MSDLMLYAAVRAQNSMESMRRLPQATQERARRLRDEERGQTAAEYLGIIVVVALIIATVVGSGLDNKISTALGKVVDNISSGKSDAKGGGGGGGGAKPPGQ